MFLLRDHLRGRLEEFEAVAERVDGIHAAVARERHPTSPVGALVHNRSTCDGGAVNLQNGQPTIRVATWNLEWAERSRVRSQQADVIARAAADLWVLTEARPDVLPEGWLHVTSTDIPPAAGASDSFRDAGYFAVIGAPELRKVEVPELPTAACALVPVAGQTWLVLGICMPWRRDAPPLPEGAAPGAADGPAQWRMVLTRLDAALERLAPLVDSRRVLLAGDLNQTLSGRNVGFAGGRTLLEKVLSRHDLVAYTATASSRLPDCPSVDHVCGPALPYRLEPWPVPGESLSDHRGYVVELG